MSASGLSARRHERFAVMPLCRDGSPPLLTESRASRRSPPSRRQAALAEFPPSPPRGEGLRQAECDSEAGAMTTGLTLPISSRGSSVTVRTTARLGGLHRRTGNGTVRAEHATVACQGTQQRAAARTLVKVDASIRRHCFNRQVAAPGTGQLARRVRGDIRVHAYLEVGVGSCARS